MASISTELELLTSITTLSGSENNMFWKIAHRLEPFADNIEMNTTDNITTTFQDHRQGKRDTGREKQQLMILIG